MPQLFICPLFVVVEADDRLQAMDRAAAIQEAANKTVGPRLYQDEVLMPEPIPAHYEEHPTSLLDVYQVPLAANGAATDVANAGASHAS